MITNIYKLPTGRDKDILSIDRFITTLTCDTIKEIEKAIKEIGREEPIIAIERERETIEEEVIIMIVPDDEDPAWLKFASFFDAIKPPYVELPLLIKRHYLLPGETFFSICFFKNFGGLSGGVDLCDIKHDRTFQNRLERGECDEKGFPINKSKGEN